MVNKLTPSEIAALKCNGLDCEKGYYFAETGGPQGAIPVECPTCKGTRGRFPMLRVTCGECGGEGWKQHKYAEHGTSDCANGCGAWAGPSRSGGPDEVDPFGTCPRAHCSCTDGYTVATDVGKVLEVAYSMDAIVEFDKNDERDKAGISVGMNMPSGTVNGEGEDSIAALYDALGKALWKEATDGK